MRSNKNISSLILSIPLLFILAGCTQGNSSGTASVELWDTHNDWAGELPGREWGATSAVYPDKDGRHIWVGERCGANGNCLDTPDIDPVVKFNPEGEVVASFGKGIIVWPHGLHVDNEGNVWVADARVDLERGKGNQVHKFSVEGELLMSLGIAGVAGKGAYFFDQPCDVLVAPNGDIFVADGHSAAGNNRIVKYNSAGEYLMEWGSTGSNPGQFRTPHALAMDSQGLLYVGDRSNRRVQVFDQEGGFITDYYQFGRPSGVFIDSHDHIYVADSESREESNPGYRRGIRVAEIAGGAFVYGFIDDPLVIPSGTSAAEGVAVDAQGNIFGAEVGPRQLVKYTRK
ncbi:MAG: hypothetical protein COC19_04395 [SAR86 cluster bacterium]|uniref:6-bladed beta-propeller n=1 Tax=SAR86 cluster bacterium TaxID=2030880 RepID=A0A2A4MPT9_9GAMM|nr:MAG: hypothetical protein COC19_04395 [SAR86 cluster bacterium]